MFWKKKETNPDTFWQDYEAKIGETVLARALGKYLSGWSEYAEQLWGLVIATSGGFRFHHFPHEGWIVALTRITSGGEAPKEKTIFIPTERIINVKLLIEKRWWKKLLTPSAPVLTIRYRTGVNEEEATLVVETEMNAQEVYTALQQP